jgi:predicted CXXCH cytochrome family protein
MPSRRVVSWALAAFILLAFLMVPVYSHLTRGPDPHARVIGDGAWDPGPLSLAHHGLKDRCQACHVKPFESVRDDTCRSCHKTVHDHASPARLAAARASLPLGDRLLWGVAHAFGKPGPGACVDCHREHEGAGPMEPTRQQFCADCHGSLKERLNDTKLGDAGDFGLLHPQFSPAVMTDPLAARPTRVSLDQPVREANGLTFPHKLHLDPRGGVARMAIDLGAGRGYGAALTCANCHHATEDGVRFKPVNMERDCEACHSLAYDRVGATYRTLRHGDVDQMIADLSASDRGAEPIVTGRHRPGSYSAGGVYYANFALPQAGIGSIQRALGKDGVCGECHTPLYRNGKPGVVPVTQISRFMAHGWFDHAAHKQEKCTSCHAADRSTSASDLLLPGIKQCRTCHLGEDASKAKVPSGCAMCHGYHPTPLAPAALRDERRGRFRSPD